MVKIYKDTRTNKLYALEEQITMGNKVCLVPFDKGEDKFVAPSTLKRWFTPWGDEQVVVEVKAFTGMKIGLFKVAAYTNDTYSVWTKDDKQMIFERNKDFREDDKQINAKNPKYANKVGRIFGWFIPNQNN